MKNKILFTLISALTVAPSLYSAESLPNKDTVERQIVSSSAADSSLLTGKWTYRSYRNDPSLVGDDADKALKLIFGEGVFTFEVLPKNNLKGVFDMGGGYVLDLKGEIQPAAQEGTPLTISLNGYGRAGTPTAGWEYDYHGSIAYQWPNGINQVPSMVGSVIRAKPHGEARAGYVASFIAVKQQQ
jgi:hypothetical protein